MSEICKRLMFFRWGVWGNHGYLIFALTASIFILAILHSIIIIYVKCCRDKERPAYFLLVMETILVIVSCDAIIRQLATSHYSQPFFIADTLIAGMLYIAVIVKNRMK